MNRKNYNKKAEIPARVSLHKIYYRFLNGIRITKNSILTLL